MPSRRKCRAWSSKRTMHWTVLLFVNNKPVMPTCVPRRWVEMFDNFNKSFFNWTYFCNSISLVRNSNKLYKWKTHLFDSTINDWQFFLLKLFQAEEEARNLQKKIQTVENDLDQTQEALTQVNTKLEEKNKALQNVSARHLGSFSISILEKY